MSERDVEAGTAHPGEKLEGPCYFSRSSSVVVSCAGLGGRLLAAIEEGHGDARRDARGGSSGAGLQRTGRHRQGLVETAGIPEIRLRATDAAVPRLDREGDAAVPFHRGAGVVGHRPLAAELEQAPAAARAFVVEGLGELALVVERPPVAAVVDRLAVEGLGPAQRIEFGQRTEGEVVRDDAGHHGRDRRAAGDVHHRFVLDEFRDRHRAGRIRLRRRQAAVGRAGAHGDHRRRILHRLAKHVDVGDAGDGRVARDCPAAPSRRPPRCTCRRCPSSPLRAPPRRPRRRRPGACGDSRARSDRRSGSPGSGCANASGPRCSPCIPGTTARSPMVAGPSPAPSPTARPRRPARPAARPSSPQNLRKSRRAIAASFKRLADGTRPAPYFSRPVIAISLAGEQHDSPQSTRAGIEEYQGMLMVGQVGNDGKIPPPRHQEHQGAPRGTKQAVLSIRVFLVQLRVLGVLVVKGFQVD